jgi:hypothetical protein
LADLVTSGISKTGEEREELLGHGNLGRVLEDDLIEGRRGSDFALVRHQSLRNRVNLRIISLRSTLVGEGGVPHTGWKTASSAIPAEPVHIMLVL